MPLIVTIREFERGWGSKVISRESFDSADKAQARADEINSKNTDHSAPDYYVQASVEFEANKR